MENWIERRITSYYAATAHEAEQQAIANWIATHGINRVAEGALTNPYTGYALLRADERARREIVS